MKKCKKCGKNKHLSEFYKSGRKNGYSARCRACHSVAVRICIMCGRSFEGLPSKKLCSTECRAKHRPQTFKNCSQCGTVFGPVDRLSVKYCSRDCKHKAQTTGRKTQRKTKTKARLAQSLVAYHIKVGNIIRPDTCEDCGSTDKKIEAAHYDYDKPIKVKWLCRSCHVKWDKAEPKGGMLK